MPTLVHSIYLMRVDWDRRASASRAIHGARRALGMDTSTHSAAFEIVRRCWNDGGDPTPTLIGNATSEGTLELAKRELDQNASDGLLIYAIDPTPEEVLNPTSLANVPAEPETPAPEVFEPEVYETAMMLLVGMRGNAFGALSIAGGLARTTRSDSFKRVQACIVQVFPVDSGAVLAAVQEAMGEDPDGAGP